MENRNDRLVMVDSCVFIEIILQQPLSAKCEDQLNLIRKQERKVCVSMEILYEIMIKIYEDIEEEIKERNPTLNNSSEKLRIQTLNGHLSILKKLLDGATVVSVSADYPEIRNKCNDIRVDNCIRGERDKINISTAIDNKCIEFVTKDSKIYEERKKIKAYSNNILEVYLIK